MHGRHFFQNTAPQNKLLLDKSLFLKEFIDNTTAVQGISRPSHCGKTFIASMIFQFFSIAHNNDQNVFQNLKIWQTGDRYRSKRGAYPVIYLSFHDFKGTSKKEFDDFYREMMAQVYLEYRDILFNGVLKDHISQQQYNEICQGENPILKRSLDVLMGHLYKQYQARIILIIDDYDKPYMQSVYHQFYDEMAITLDNYLVQALRSIHLQKAFLTGRLPFPRTHSFSGINHIKRYTIFDNVYSQYFEFNHDEINLNSLIPSCPFISKLNSSPEFIKQKLYELSCGNTISCPINKNISYDTLNKVFNSQKIEEINILGILLHMGYLSATSWECKNDQVIAELKILDANVLEGFKQLTEAWGFKTTEKVTYGLV